MGFMDDTPQAYAPSLSVYDGQYDPTLQNRFQQQQQGAATQQQNVEMLRAQAAGTGPNAGMAQLNQGVQNQANFGMAVAAGARGGQLGVGNAYKNALGNAVGAGQQGAAQAQVLQAQQQIAGRSMAMQAQMQQRVAALQAAGMSAQQAQQQAQLEMDTNRLNAGIQIGNQNVHDQLIASALMGAGSALTGAGGMGGMGGGGGGGGGPSGDMAWSGGPGGY